MGLFGLDPKPLAPHEQESRSIDRSIPAHGYRRISEALCYFSESGVR
jgi:hypothetical protein